MRPTWTGHATAAIALSLGLVLMVVTAAAPPKQSTSVLEPEGQQATQGSFGRAERGSREFPTRGTLGLTFGPSTAGGGAYIECLGTFSHASIDNNFARLMDEARKRCGTSTGS